MRYLVLILFLAFILRSAEAQKIKIQDPVHFLALGDSYTIGQSISISDRWPNQLASELSGYGYTVAEVKFIAQTGWRTDNLKNAIEQQQPLSGYNLVSLLIGVNNQYQGGSTATYYTDFESLLKTALQLASNKPEHVFVLSIPDYAYTPFGGGSSVISNQIDEFNSINRIITASYNIKYIDITPISRMGLLKPELVANDGLHPSCTMYGLWVQEILKSVEIELGVEDEPEFDQNLSYTIEQQQLTVKSSKYRGLAFIYNSSGQILNKGLISANSGITFNLDGLAAGLYFLVVKNKEKIVLKAKFILK
jgi:lysophospholipase L1-like esterase